MQNITKSYKLPLKNNKLIKKWHVSFHFATRPAKMQSTLYKKHFFYIFLNRD